MHDYIDNYIFANPYCGSRPRRAAANSYFIIIIDSSVEFSFQLLRKLIKCQQMVRNADHKFPAQGDIFKFLVMSNQKSRTQTYLVYNTILRKAAKRHIWEAENPRKFAIYAW